MTSSATWPLTVPAADLTAWVHGHRDEMLEELRAYVEIETPSDDRAALERGLAFVEAWITGHLGEPSARTVTDGGEHGDTVVLDLPGDLPGAPVAVLAHYDTVWPVGTLAGMPFSLEDDVLRGPGVFDMKSGLVQLVWGLKALQHFGVPRRTVRLLLNGDEEVGSPVARTVIEDVARSAAEVLVLEASGPGVR